MQREAAGIATLLPIMNFVEISHQTGAQFIALSRQTIELINWLRQERPDQIMKRHVPVFHAASEIKLLDLSKDYM